MMKTKVKPNTCAFDSENLDDWLESDLRLSGILPSKCDKNDNDGSKCDKYIKLEEINDWETHNFGDGSDDKTVVGDSDAGKAVRHSTYNPTSSTLLAPILKAFLAALHQQRQGVTVPPLFPFLSPGTSPSSPKTASSSSILTQDAIDPSHISKTSGASSSTKSSTFEMWNTSTTSTTTKRKRRREFNSESDATNVTDPLVLKRLKNTDAARRSRQRKVMKMEGLQTRVADLEKSNEQLRLQVISAEKERDIAKVKEAKLQEKVVTLEAQLAKAHRSLLEKVKQESLDPEELGGDGNDGVSQESP